MGIHATVIGHLGRDAESKVTPGGKSVCNFNIGANNPRDKTATTWVRCALWGARGEKLASYLTKGARVAAVGTLIAREYEHNGQRKTSVELDVSELELLGDRADKPKPAPSMTDDYAGDDVPF